MECSRILLQKNELFSPSFTFFAKERGVLFCSLQKNVTFFSVLWKRTEHSFGSHKSPKTRKKNGTFLLKNEKEWNVPN